MIIIGDIGNTDTKICIINSNYKIIKRILLPTKKINNSLLAKKLNFIVKRNIYIEKSLFCSVVPNQFLFIKSFLQKKFKTLVKKFHPDRNSGNKQFEDKLKKVTMAYSHLKLIMVRK